MFGIKVKFGDDELFVMESDSLGNMVRRTFHKEKDAENAANAWRDARVIDLSEEEE